MSQKIMVKLFFVWLLLFAALVSVANIDPCADSETAKRCVKLHANDSDEKVLLLLDAAMAKSVTLRNVFDDLGGEESALQSDDFIFPEFDKATLQALVRGLHEAYRVSPEKDHIFTEAEVLRMCFPVSPPTKTQVEQLFSAVHRLDCKDLEAIGTRVMRSKLMLPTSGAARKRLNELGLARSEAFTSIMKPLAKEVRTLPFFQTTELEFVNNTLYMKTVVKSSSNRDLYACDKKTGKYISHRMASCGFNTKMALLNGKIYCTPAYLNDGSRESVFGILAASGDEKIVRFNKYIPFCIGALDDALILTSFSSNPLAKSGNSAVHIVNVKEKKYEAEEIPLDCTYPKDFVVIKDVIFFSSLPNDEGASIVSVDAQTLRNEHRAKIISKISGDYSGDYLDRVKMQNSENRIFISSLHQNWAKDIFVLNVSRPDDMKWETPIKLQTTVTALVVHKEMLFVAYDTSVDHRDRSTFGVVAFDTQTQRQIPLIDNEEGYVTALAVNDNELYVGATTQVHVYELNPWLFDPMIPKHGLVAAPQPFGAFPENISEDQMNNLGAKDGFLYFFGRRFTMNKKGKKSISSKLARALDGHMLVITGIESLKTKKKVRTKCTYRFGWMPVDQFDESDSLAQRQAKVILKAGKFNLSYVLN